MLLGELATHLSGRYVAFHIHSLYYQEFLQFLGLENSFESMLKYGGMPFLANLGLEGDKPSEYLRNVYSTILLKDVVARENMRNISF